jgi:hypothetical protein
VHEVDDELREGGVERAIGERQGLGISLDHVDPGQARPACVNERR